MNSLAPFVLLAAASFGSPLPPPSDALEPRAPPSAATLAQVRELRPLYQSLHARWSTLASRERAHDARCSSVPEGSALAADCLRSKHAIEADFHAYHSDLEVYDKRWQQVHAAAYAIDPGKVVDSLVAFARKERWGEKEIERIEKAFDDLGPGPGDPASAKATWTSILQRSPDDALRRSFAGAAGPKLVWSGRQTMYQDCVIFALANASGRPYGVVAAMAGKIVGSGSFRRPAARLQPQKVIEEHGLTAGEVIVLAEGLGRVSIREKDDFAPLLRRGVPVLVSLHLGNGEHQVVLNKTFRHGGRTWFGLLDSNHGQLYLREDELELLRAEAGIIYRPEPLPLAR